MGMILKTGAQVDRAHLNALEEHSIESRSEGKTTYYKVRRERQQEIEVHRRSNERYRTAGKLLPRTFLVSFVSTFDAFLGNLMQAAFDARPETLNSSERKLTYKELTSFESIEAARLHVVESEVEAMLRLSHYAQFELIKKKFHCNRHESSWKTFIEVTERRNLFVHCHAKVSPQYINVCKEHGVDIGDVAVGETLGARKNYLDEAYKCLVETGVILSQNLWRKLCPAEIEDADHALAKLTFDLLVDEQYDLARRLLQFAKDQRCSSEVVNRVTIINLALAFKFGGDEAKCEATLKAADWSACGDDFALCVAVLSDKFETAAVHMRRIGNNGAVGKLEYADWPVFKVFRESEEFKAAYADIFGSEPGDYVTHEQPASVSEASVENGANEGAD